MSLFYKIQLTGRSIPKHIFPDNLWISWQTLSINQWWIVQKIIQQLVGTTWNFVLATKSHYHYVKMSSSDSFTNLETTNLRKCFVKLILFIHTYIYAVNVNNNIKFYRFVGSKYSWNHLRSRSLADDLNTIAQKTFHLAKNICNVNS